MDVNINHLSKWIYKIDKIQMYSIKWHQIFKRIINAKAIKTRNKTHEGSLPLNILEIKWNT